MTTKSTDTARRDLFAAHALQGLLASGKFTEHNGDQEWAVIDVAEEYDDDGNKTGRRRYTPVAVELAWRFADWMVRDEPKE